MKEKNDRSFASPKARNTNMLVSLALGDANFLRRPCTFLFFCVDFFALGSQREPHSQWNIGGVGSLRWACTFHASGDANSTQRKPGFRWNMGLRSINTCILISLSLQRMSKVMQTI